MAFLFKLVIYGAQFALGFIVILFMILAIVFLVSRGIQLFARLLGYETGSFFNWLIGGIAKRLGWKKVEKGDTHESR